MFILLLLLPHLFHVWIWISSLIPLCPFNLFIKVQTWRRQRAHTRTHTHTNIYIYVCVYIYTHKFEGFFYYFGLISSSSSLTLNWSLHVLISIYSEPFFVAENHSESGGVANNGGAFNDTGTQMQKSKSIRQNRPINRFSINDQISSKKWSLPVRHRWNKSQRGSKQIYMYANEPPPPPLRSLPRWIPQLASAVEMMATFCLWNGIETEWFAVSDWLASDGLWLVNLSTCHPHITAVTMASRQDGNNPQTPVGDPRKNPQKNLPESEFINQSVELNVTVATIIKKNPTTFKWFRTMEPMICSVIILLIFELGWLLLAFVLTS